MDHDQQVNAAASVAPLIKLPENGEEIGNKHIFNGLLALQSQFQDFRITLSTVEENQKQITSRVSYLEERNQFLEKENVELKSSVAEIVNQQELLYKMSSTSNLVKNGMHQQQVDEKSEQSIQLVKDFFESQLDIKNVDISTAFRMRNAKSNNKPILVKLVHESDKFAIFAAAKTKLAGSRITIKPDRSKHTRETRGILSSFYTDLKDQKKDVKMFDNYLVVNDEKFEYDPDTQSLVKMARK